MDYLGAMRLFVRVIDLGSFSQAATDRHTKVSTVSRAVTALEEDLGITLINRTTRRLHPTEAGMEFYDRASRILAEVEGAREQMASLSDRPQGLLRLNIPGAFGRRHVMPFLPGFLRRYPDISIDVELTEKTVDLIDVGADLAIRIGVLPASTMVARKLAGHRRVLCASPAYLQSAPTLDHPRDLARQACLGFSLLQPAGHWRFRKDAETVDVAISGPLKANDSEALLDAALGGLGIVLLPNWLAGSEIAAKRLISLLPDWEGSLAPGDRAIWAIYPPKKVLSPKVRVFLDFIEARFGAPPYWDRRAPAE